MGQALRMRRAMRQYKSTHVGFWTNSNSVPPSTFNCPAGTNLGKQVSSTHAPPPGPPPGTDNPDPQPDDRVPANCTCAAPSYWQDGWCDSENNNADCCFDGGDCCEASCHEHVELTGPKQFACGTNGYDCKDPSVGGGGSETAAPTSEPSRSPQTPDTSDPGGTAGSEPTSEAATPPTATPDQPSLNDFHEDACLQAGGRLDYLDDRYCDSRNNILECNYDYGDCCAASCGSLSPEFNNFLYDCGIDSVFVCIDPNYEGPHTSHNVTTTRPPFTTSTGGDIVLGAFSDFTRISQALPRYFILRRRDPSVWYFTFVSQPCHCPEVSMTMRTCVRLPR